MAPQREWFEKDYYKILGLAEDASAKDATRAYRKLARKHHPDANPGDASAEARFKEIAAAYDVIGDPEKRQEYDEVRKQGPVGGFGSGAGPGGYNVRMEDMGDLGDLLGGLFGGRGRGRGGAAARGRPGADLVAELHLAFIDAVHGVTTTVNVSGAAQCATCHGSGAAPGTHPVTCSRCAGRGVVDDNQGFFSFSSPCPTCRGKGQVVEQPCPSCRGTGRERRSREVKVRLPAGVEDGQRIRVKGRGEPGEGGGHPGDLIVSVHVAAHPLFGRKGRDLVLTLPITYPEATLGTEISVPTLDGARVTLRVPAGTRSGRTFRVRGRGVNATAGSGDLLITVDIAIPAQPSAAERKLLEELSKLGDSGIRAHLATMEPTP